MIKQVDLSFTVNYNIHDMIDRVNQLIVIFKSEIRKFESLTFDYDDINTDIDTYEATLENCLERLEKVLGLLIHWCDRFVMTQEEFERISAILGGVEYVKPTVHPKKDE